jgi:hypothetical protein
MWITMALRRRNEALEVLDTPHGPMLLWAGQPKQTLKGPLCGSLNLSRSCELLWIAGETDTQTGAVAATRGSATVTITGAEQSQ